MNQRLFQGGFGGISIGSIPAHAWKQVWATWLCESLGQDPRRGGASNEQHSAGGGSELRVLLLSVL